MSIHCYAALNPKQALQPFEYDPKPLGPHDVEIQISHCGICHSDIHLCSNPNNAHGSSQHCFR